jgi:hypothetical protein
MKIIICSLIIIFAFNSCDFLPWEKNKEKERFINTYKEILIIREKYPDTTIANPKVRIIIKINGYTQDSFRDKFYEYSKDGEEFMKMLDSARTRASRQLIKQKMKMEKNKSD